MTGHVAVSDSPLYGRIREVQAKIAGREFLNFIATITLFYNGIAVTPIKLTSIFVHKKTIRTFFYRCTNHGYHILSKSSDK